MAKQQREMGLPTPQQLDFLSWEFGLFFHFGIRSCYPGHQDFDGQHMDLSAFNPQHLDCDAWARVAVQAGARYGVLTAKHHDGFALWPTAHSPYSVKNTPYQNGQGDVVAQFVAACRRHGLRVGLYYSPAQWGQGPAFTPGPAYDDYFIAQISELLSGYGRIDYLWFDGAGSAGHQYDKARIVHAIRSLQPDILLFNLWDPDTLWAGNEDGYAGLDNQNLRRGLLAEQLLQERDEQEGSFARFLPLECDTKLRSTWFDSLDNVNTIKGLAELMGIYELSVGRGANLLLNIGPDKDGRLPAPDLARLAAFAEAIRRRYGAALQGFSFHRAADRVYLQAEEAQLVDRLVLQEDLRDGQQIQGFSVLATLTGGQVLHIYTGKTIGHKHICAFPPIRAKAFTILCEPSGTSSRIARLSAHPAPEDGNQI